MYAFTGAISGSPYSFIYGISHINDGRKRNFEESGNKSNSLRNVCDVGFLILHFIITFLYLFLTSWVYYQNTNKEVGAVEKLSTTGCRMQFLWTCLQVVWRPDSSTISCAMPLKILFV